MVVYSDIQGHVGVPHAKTFQYHGVRCGESLFGGIDVNCLLSITTI